jgi:hypothetical protein
MTNERWKVGCQKVDFAPTELLYEFFSNLASRYGKLVHKPNGLVNLWTNLPYTVTHS